MKIKSRFTFLSLILLTSACAVKSKPDVSSVTRASAATDTASFRVFDKEGFKLIQLETKDRDGKELLQLTVAPEAGSNIVSLRYRELEILEQPSEFKNIVKQDAGIEFLYPTPNRVRNGALKYKDLKLKFTPNLGAHFIHGLAREAVWSWDPPVIVGHRVSLKTWLESTSGSAFYQGFPIKNRIEMTVVLDDDAVSFDFTVINLDQRSLPFGLGIHPYFKLNGSRSQNSVQLRVANEMVADEMLPTGKLIPLGKSKYSPLIKEMSVADVLGADTVFWPKLGNAVVHEPGFKFDIASSADFGHTVLWAPPTRDLFAVENQTSSTDAHNLAEKGFVKESGLIELAPGAKWTGSVTYRFAVER